MKNMLLHLKIIEYLIVYLYDQEDEMKLGFDIVRGSGKLKPVNLM